MRGQRGKAETEESRGRGFGFVK